MIFHLVSPIKTPFTEKKKENSSHRSLSRWTIATSDSDGFSKCAFRIPRIKRWRPQRGAYVPWRASAPAGGYALGHKQNMRWNSYTRHTRKFGGKTARASLRLPLLLENFPFSIPHRMCAFRFGGGWLWLFLVLIVFKFYLRDFWSGSDQRNFIKLIFFSYILIVSSTGNIIISEQFIFEIFENIVPITKLAFVLTLIPI